MTHDFDHQTWRCKKCGKPAFSAKEPCRPEGEIKEVPEHVKRNIARNM